LTAAERGVAHHTFLQGLDFTRAATELDLRNEAARLVAGGLLTARESDALDFADLLQFCESSVGRAVRTEAAAGRVQREVPFTARFTVAELAGMGLLPGVGRHGEAGHDEFLIVQGVADLVVFRPAEIWLLDYKTDHFPEAELAQKVRDYGPQLSLYALALERIHGRRVTRTWLHFMALARTELL
jgi:ATP-dependent helicase/nuclease subunit A